MNIFNITIPHRAYQGPSSPPQHAILRFCASFILVFARELTLGRSGIISAKFICRKDSHYMSDKKHTIKKQFVEVGETVKPDPGELSTSSAPGSITVTSSATATAISVAPDYGALWTKLGSEFTGLDDRVVQGLIDETITWKRAGIPIAEEIAQISYGGSPEMKLDPKQVFKSFARAEQDRRKTRHELRLKNRDIVAAFLGGGALVALIAWLSSS